MTFEQIVNLVCAKVGEIGDYAKARCLEYTQNRHQMIYKSFDWTAAQDTIDQRLGALQDRVEIPSAEKIISARFISDDRPGNSQGDFLDPVSLSYIYESHPEMLVTPGNPIFYWSGFDSGSHSVIVRPFPSPPGEGTLSLLIKKQIANIGTQDSEETVLPGIEDALIAFVLADMWEFMRQLGKSKIKLDEAQALLTEAQKRDTPATPRPRTSKVLTASGVTLVELTDSVCDIVGQWEPAIRQSIKERIRRNYQILWDMYLWLESTIIAKVPISPDQQQVVLSHLFDRVVEVRTNKGGPLTQVTPLDVAEISLYFGVAPDIFEQSGEPTFFSMLPNVGVSVLPPFNEPIECVPDNVDDYGTTVFLKGESRGVEVSESITIRKEVPTIGDGPPSYFFTSANTYDTPLTVTKPDTKGPIRFNGATSHLELLVLGPQERERKHMRIWLLPNKGGYPDSSNITTDPGTILVLGKRQISPLVDDGDTPQLRNVQNALINAAASDILSRPGGNADLAVKLSTQAQAQVQVLVKAETEQNAYQPQILPYTENYYCRRGRINF